MNVPIWLLAIAPPVIFCLGFFIAAAVTVGKASDDADWELTALCLSDDLKGVEAEHHRCADALATKQARIDRLKSIAASQQSVKSGRIVAVLEGGE